MEHRRSDRRYERRITVDINHGGRAFTGHSRNIGLGGVFLETEETLPFGAKVTIRFRVPTQPDPVEVDGQVRWLEVQEGKLRGLGVRFEGLRARDVWALNKWFETPIEAR